MINDDDDSGTRDGKLSWNAATDQAWTDASLFGTGKLLDQQIVTDYSDTQDESKIFFPNPVQNSLQFSNKGEIFNLNGTLLLEGTNEINVEKLESGCYLFRNNNKIFKIIKE